MSLPCLHWPYCHYGNQCKYEHPPIPCKFKVCCNTTCNYFHPKDGIPSPYYLTLPKVQAMINVLAGTRKSVPLIQLYTKLHVRHPTLTMIELLSLLNTYTIEKNMIILKSDEPLNTRRDPVLWNQQRIRFITPSQRPAPLAAPAVPTGRNLAGNQIGTGKGFDLLCKMGWTPGMGLGKDHQGRVDPVPIQIYSSTPFI